MQLRIAVLKFPYSFFSKQGKRVKIAKVAVNRNEIYFVKRMIYTSILSCILTCSYDTSFLARILVIRDGDVESNPGPSDIDFSIKKQETLRVGGRPRKSGFKGKCTKKESSLVSEKPIGINQNSSSRADDPIGLINHSNDCFFNSVIQALFSLQSFRDHVMNFDERNFDKANSHTKNAASSIKRLFRAIEQMKATSDGPLTTHNYIMAMNLQGYSENEQFDAQECLSYIVELLVQKELHFI